jgi:two-component system nitrogen regulation sensor histidine kinase NtrY
MPKNLSHSRRILMLSLATGLPGLLAALWFIWRADWTMPAKWVVSVLIAGASFGMASITCRTVARPLRTLSSQLAALREGDFSIKARGARPDDPLGQVREELNGLTENLREQRLSALEASALLRKVMEEIEVAVFTFDHRKRLRLTNRAGERLLGRPLDRLEGLSADDLGLTECLAGESVRVLEMSFPGGTGRWDIRHSGFRQEGLPHRLLVLTNLSRALRDEERLAWQRLLRVLGHELNNSLAPIKSISGSLSAIFSKDSLLDDWKEDVQHGLQVINLRAAALSRFMEAYSRLARLPQPRMKPLDIGGLVRRVAGLETRVAVTVTPGPELMIMADGDQLEQILINLIQNAVDASLETNGRVNVKWLITDDRVEIEIEDEGIGLGDTANLFVPFFTTKPGGSGIGLVLSRQIAEAHNGSLTLENRTYGSGCIARLSLPLSSS